MTTTLTIMARVGSGDTFRKVGTQDVVLYADGSHFREALEVWIHTKGLGGWSQFSVHHGTSRYKLFNACKEVVVREA